MILVGITLLIFLLCTAAYLFSPTTVTPLQNTPTNMYLLGGYDCDVEPVTDI